MKHYTTKAHYAKYRNLLIDLRIRFDETTLQSFLPRCETTDDDEEVDRIETLRNLYEKDHSLNNIPLARFDTWWNMLQTVHVPAMRMPLSYGASLGKHALIFHVLKMIPCFSSPPETSESEN